MKVQSIKLITLENGQMYARISSTKWYGLDQNNKVLDPERAEKDYQEHLKPKKKEKK